MMQRNWFFWMEALQITAAERRVILALMGVLLVVSGLRTFYPGRTIYDEHYYEPVIAEFIRLADVREEQRRVKLARYYPPINKPAGTLPQFGKDLPETPLRIAFAGEAAATGGSATPGEHVVHGQAAGPGVATETAGKGASGTVVRGTHPNRQDQDGRSRTAGGTGSGPELRINIQQAGLDELVLLPGIGPVTAGRILAYREENGPFRNPEDLLNVTGIGPRTLENIRPFIILDSEPVPANPSGHGGDMDPDPGPAEPPGSNKEKKPETP
jgi:competence ComEA-like helix-hairpin-helix protein